MVWYVYICVYIHIDMHTYIHTGMYTHPPTHPPVNGVEVARLLDHGLPPPLHLELALGLARLVAQQILIYLCVLCVFCVW